MLLLRLKLYFKKLDFLQMIFNLNIISLGMDMHLRREAPKSMNMIIISQMDGVDML